MPLFRLRVRGSGAVLSCAEAVSYPSGRAGIAQLRERMVSDVSRLPIVLCCAEEAEVALVAVVDTLHREGYAPEVLPGVELDASLITVAADRMRGPALFVLCQSDDLDRFQVRRLEGLFSARKGPQHRMITVELPLRYPMAIAGEVRGAAERLLAGSVHGNRDDGHNMRDVVMPTSIAAVPGATVPRRTRPKEPARPARDVVVSAPEGLSEEALGLTGDADKAVVDLADLERHAPTPEPDVISTDPQADEDAASGSDPRLGDGVPLVVAEDFPVVGESGQDIEVGVPRRVGSDRSGPVEVERVARSSRADPRAETDDRPLPSASSPIELGIPARASTAAAAPSTATRRGPRLLLLLVAATGMAAVVGMAVLHATAPMRVGPAEVSERGVPHEPGVADDGAAVEADAGAAVAGDAAATAEPASGSTLAGGDDDASDGTTTAAGATTGAVGMGGGTAADTSDAAASDDAGTGGSDGPDDTDDTEDTGGSDGDVADGPDPLGGPKTVPPPPNVDLSRDQLDALISAALADGRLQATGELLMLSLGPETTTWDEAVERCKRRKLDGLRGWRLPSKAQLAKLRKAKLLTTGSYWSRTTVGGDEVYVLDATTGRMNQYLQIEPNARVICVRNRP